MKNRTVRITHSPTGALIAEGPIGWGIAPFEGNLYIRRKYLRDGTFRTNFVPGLCPYKFLYAWMDYDPPDGGRVRSLGWLYWLPNPLFPFIWYRVAVPKHHPEISITYGQDV